MSCREYWQVDCRAQISGACGTGEIASVAKARNASVRKPDAGLAGDWLDFNGRIPSDSVWPEVENLDRRRFAVLPFKRERHGRRMHVVVQPLEKNGLAWCAVRQAEFVGPFR